MQVRVATRESVSVAYLRHTGPYGESIGRFWAETAEPWLVSNGLQACPRYGISYDDPSVTSPSKCRYDACVEAPVDLPLTGKAQRTIIPGGRYAVLDFKGTASAIGEEWASLMRDWLPSSGLQLDNRPCFEYYPKDSTYDAATGEFECQICIPVTSL